MPKQYYEKVAVASALHTFLVGKGWSSLGEIKIGFQSDLPLTVPAVSIFFLASRQHELQMGRDKPEYNRPVQVDAYMETEARAESICDDIADFFDQETVSVIDADTASIIAVARVFDNNSIILDTRPPIMTDAKLLRWRGVVKAVLNVDYLNG